MKIYLVGGAVRDHLLGLPAREKDYVVVGSTPEELISQGFRPVGKDFPVFIHPRTGEEYALARTERKTGKGYTQFECHFSPKVTLEDDLKRRDLTINAMALDAEGHLIDPYGGQHDLQHKLLRHVSSAFTEDPVRVLRVARFCARYAPLGFKIADETRSLLKQIVRSGEINDLVPERVWQEMQRALTEPDPVAFFGVLRECGALQILLPELDNLFGIPAKAEYHPEIDTGVHTMMVLRQAARLTENPVARFAALMHDLGKGQTPTEIWPSHIGHEAAGVPIIKAICTRFKIPNEYQALATLTAKYHLYVHRASELRPGTLVRLFERLDAFRRPERFELFLLASEADFRGRPGFETKVFPASQLLQKTFYACQEVNVKGFINQEMTGEQIKSELKKLRIKQVAQVLGTCTK